MKILGVLIFIFLIGFAIAKCNDSQIDINSAAAEELDKIVYVGSATAENIIDSRPFDNLDELTKVYGIGEAKLDAIKKQGLACVENEKFSDNSDDKDETEKETETKIENIYFEENKTEPIKKPEIKLSPQNIKTSDSTENPKKKYAIYGLIFFSLLIAGLFFFKIKKQRFEENEFR